LRKWLRCSGAAALLVVLVLLAVAHQPHAPRIRTGKPLPPGKVRPQLVSNWDTAVLLAPDGSLWVWGETNNGFPLSALSQVPRRVGSDSDWTQVAGTSGLTVALKNDGSLWAWGWNHNGKVGQTNLTNYYNTPTRIGSETNWTRISVGLWGGHTLALKNDGSLWAWGANDFGQLGDGTTNHRPVPAMIGIDRDWRTMAAAQEASFALKSNGTLWAWGEIRGSNTLAPRQLDAGAHWLSISPCDPPSGPALLALKSDGTFWLNNLGSQPNWLGALALGQPGASNTSASPVSAHPVSGPAPTSGQIGLEKDWAEVYSGATFSFYARKRDGSWWVCGDNHAGQLGIGVYDMATPTPQRLPFDFEPWAFAPGPGTTLMLGRDGKLWSWGRRLGVGKPSAARRMMQHLLRPVEMALWRYPGLGGRLGADLDRIDRAPVLLWELPPAVPCPGGRTDMRSTSIVPSGRK
jgi:alpha-tubulin suppressor-like RCC1 family protein